MEEFCIFVSLLKPFVSRLLVPVQGLLITDGFIFLYELLLKTDEVRVVISCQTSLNTINSGAETSLFPEDVSKGCCIPLLQGMR